MHLTVDLAGWIGAAILLIAYALVSFDKLRGESFRYQFLNAVGSLLLIVNTVYYRAYPSAFVNVVWIVIAFLASVRARNRQSRAAGS
jgi:phosphoglycerol transferase MdoB-like AlkP superfamily enzyme